MISKPNRNDTIFALATAPGRAGVAVFRVSGPAAISVAAKLTTRRLPKARVAALRQFVSRDKSPLDEGLLILMPGPASFTGEDCAEFHSHGSPAVIEAFARAFLDAGARQAQAGEFTRRAFENGRMDLTEAEGLADLIDAQTDAQRAQALRQMQGGLKARYHDWKEQLLDALAQIEGEIDFPDEEDVPDDLSHKAYVPLSALAKDMQDALDNAGRGEAVRSGLEIAILGAPNAGKSSLLNSLAGRDAAIVTAQAGTTRDIVEVNMDIAGLPIRLSDTAGIRDSVDLIEAEGIRRGIARAEDADIRILVHDTTLSQLDDAAQAYLKAGDIIVLNKIDMASPRLKQSFEHITIFPLSTQTSEGLSELQAYLEHDVKARFSPARDAGLTRARHRDCVSRALASVARAQGNLSRAAELSGDDLRSALQALRELSGETDIEAVFDRIFSRFCVGK